MKSTQNNKFELFFISTQNFRLNLSQVLILFFSCLHLMGCSTSSYLKYDKEEELRKNTEFEEIVVIRPVDSEKNKSSGSQPQVPDALKTELTQDSNLGSELLKAPPKTNGVPLALKESQTKSTSRDKTQSKNQPTTQATTQANGTNSGKTSSSSAKSDREQKGRVAKGTKIQNPSIAAPELVPVPVRQPDIEDRVGFDPGSRRPKVDPFRVGESIVHSVRYFSAEAGKLTFETKPMKDVNGKKSYHFYIGLKTSSLFSKFYSVDDYVETFVDYDQLIPHVFRMHARETGKLVQAHSFFDHEKLKATFWEKKYTEKNGEEIKNQSWDLLPFSQNAFSGLFYMRVFQWEIGKEYSFRVSDDEKNVVFKGIAEAKETIETEAGTFNAIKIKALILSRGALTPTGNIYFWLSDDHRKIPLRIVAEIKIGKLVSEIIELE